MLSRNCLQERWISIKGFLDQENSFRKLVFCLNTHNFARKMIFAEFRQENLFVCVFFVCGKWRGIYRVRSRVLGDFKGFYFWKKSKNKNGLKSALKTTIPPSLLLRNCRGEQCAVLQNALLQSPPHHIIS